MNYIAVILGFLVLPALSTPLDLTYKVQDDWAYCEIHRKECDAIANFDDSILPTFKMQPAVTTEQWAMFITLQLADIYTTYKGLQYDCVYESNPIMGNNPSVTKMFVTKTIIMAPAIKYDLGRGNLTPRDMKQMNVLMSLVIANNYNVYQGAKAKCIKIR